MKTIKAIPYDFPQAGCYVDASAGSADHCNCRTIRVAQGYGFNPPPLPRRDDKDYPEYLSETADRALDFLNDKETRSFMYWQFEDNSLFLTADVQTARDDVDFVSSKAQDYPPADYRGEWLQVSDHGNATLYVRSEDGTDVEIWGVV